MQKRGEKKSHKVEWGEPKHFFFFPKNRWKNLSKKYITYAIEPQPETFFIHFKEDV